MAKKWIQAMHMKKGALHAQLGVPTGNTIPAGKLQKAAKAGGVLGKRAQLAQTLSSFHHTIRSPFGDISRTAPPVSWAAKNGGKFGNEL